jgi:UDP-N-acetylglucosamine 2-epimerase
MKSSKLVLGNSSSGIIEAPSFSIPTVNVGSRQNGRQRAPSVIDCSYEKEEIIAAIKKALSKKFRDSLVNCKNPYDPYNDGNFSERAIRILNNLPDKKILLSKKLDFEVNNHEWNKLLEKR